MRKKIWLHAIYKFKSQKVAHSPILPGIIWSEIDTSEKLNTTIHHQFHYSVFERFINKPF